MPTPQQARVNPPARVGAEDQWRANRALTQGMDALPFFPTYEFHAIEPPGSTVNSSATPALLLLDGTVPVAVQFEKSEAWTDLVIDYRGMFYANGTNSVATWYIEIINVDSGRVAYPRTRFGHDLLNPVGTHLKSFAHARVADLPPGRYNARMWWANTFGSPVGINLWDTQFLTVTEAIPVPDLGFVPEFP